jgi:DNA-binding SARP family transcriptional activator
MLLAPAGTGKTVVLSELADEKRRQGVGVHWVHVGPPMADADVAVAGLGPVRPEETTDRTLLVLDDLQTIWGTAGEAALFETIDRLPMTTTVVVATRKEPAVDLSAWRVADDVIELGFDELRFAAREIQRLFGEILGSPMSADEIALAVERTDGWIAALRLLEAATRGRHPADRNAILALPAARWPALGEYVRANVLAGLDVDARDLLVLAGVLGRLTGARVDELLGRRESTALLAELHRRRLLVDAIVSDAYRVPRFLSVHLDAERSTRLGPAAERAWLARAGELLRRDGELIEAARCFACANRDGALASLLDGPSGEWLTATPADWLPSRPITLERHPRVALARARRRLAAGDLAGAVALYHRAEHTTPQGDAELAATIASERAAIDVWLHPDPPAVSEGSADWSAALRRATHAEPRVEADALLRRPHASPAEQLAGALGLLLAGDVDGARRLVHGLTREAGGHPAVPVVARLVEIVLDTFAFPGRGAVVELEQVVADAERLELPGLASLASDAADLLDAGPAVVARLVTDRDRLRDRWGALLVALVGGAASSRADPYDAEASGSDLLDEAVIRARQLSAGVIESWARAASAMVAARQGSPDAPETASTADHTARDVGLPGAQAVAQAAMSLLPGPRQEEHRAAAEALAAATCPSGVAMVSRMLGSPLDRPPDAMVFGRDAELAMLLARYESAELQPGPLVRVVGEAGAGKTTLLELLDQQVRLRGGLVRWVRLRRDADSHSLWAPLVRGLGQGIDADTLRAVLGVDLAAGLGAEGQGPDERRRSELLGRLLEWSAHRRPHLVVIDDADRVDTASLRQLVEVSTALRSLPLVIVLSYRADELDPESADVLDTPAAGPAVRIEGLGGDDVRALVAAELGVEPSPALVAAVTRLTGGTPGFVRETVARLGPGAAAGDAVGGLVVPEGLRDLLERRMARLAAADADVVRVAAVLGEPVDEAVVGAAIGLAPVEIAASLAAAAHLRIVRRDENGRWRFTSSIFGRVLAADVPERHRERHHRRAADHLESLAGRPGAPGADALAEHLLAGRDANATRVVRWVTQAAAEAELRGEIDRAVGLCQRALDLVGTDPSARGRLLLRVAAARRLRGGDVESSGTFLAAINAARAADDVDLFARAVVAYARALREFWRGDEHIVPLLEEAMARLPAHDSAAKVHAEARLSEVATAAAAAGRHRVVDLSTAASDRAYRLGEPGAVASALAAWYWTLTGLEDASARLDVAAELARHATEAGDWELVLDARRFRHHDLLGQGDIAGADIELAAFARLAAEHPLAGSAWRLTVARAGRALLDGRFDDAETLSAGAAVAAEPMTGSGLPAEIRVAQRLVWARETGDLTAMSPVLRQLVETRPERPFWRAAHAWLQAQTGSSAGARAELDRLVVDDLAAIEPGPYWLPGVWLLGETAVRVGRRDDAERVYRALLPWSDSVVVVPMSAAVLGSVAKVLGQLAAALGDLDDAVAHFESAIDHEIRLGAGPLLAWTKLAYARTLLLPGVQPARGEALLADAMETGRGYGMHGMLAAADELSSRLAAAPAASRPPPAAVPLAGGIAQPVVRRPRPTSRLRCLGGFELELRGRSIDVRALKPRVQAVLWVLAAQAGRPVHSEQLIDALWPGVASEAGRRNLQVAISSLRQSLEPGVKRGPWHTVAREGDTYRLVLGDDVDADIRTFELAVAAAATLRRERRHADAADRYEQALRVYGGDLIPEAGPADWIIGRRDGLRLAAAEAAQAAAELRLEAGEVRSAVNICERGLQIDRYRDGLWRLLIRCCEADGNPAAAARAQREYEAVLAELGLSPDR